MICSGALFYACDTGRFLFLHRTQGKRSNVWGLPGGTNEASETPWEACKREISEEIGTVNISKTVPLEKFLSQDDSFEYHTYLCIVEREFVPVLNHEHDGYAWVAYSKWPRPLHYGLKNTLNKKENKVKLNTFMMCNDQRKLCIYSKEKGVEIFFLKAVSSLIKKYDESYFWSKDSIKKLLKQEFDVDIEENSLSSSLVFQSGKKKKLFLIKFS